LLPRSRMLAATWSVRVQAVYDLLGRAAHDAAWAAGQATTIEDAVDRILALPQAQRALA